MNLLLNEWRAVLREMSAASAAKLFRVRSIFTMKMYASPTNTDPVYRDRLILVGCAGAGYATTNTLPPAYLIERTIGCDVREEMSPHPGLGFALLDAGFSALSKQPAFEVSLSASAADRGHDRAEIIAEEVAAYCHAKARVLLIGAVRSIIVSLESRGWLVTACDLDRSMKTLETDATRVITAGPSATLAEVDHADVIVATGMSLVNGTIAEISSAARRRKVPIIMYSQSGANLAAHLMGSLGIHSVISEGFPNYLFPGESTIKVYRQ
jgi:hypothetical protein